MCTLFVAEEWDQAKDPVCGINHQLAGSVDTNDPTIGKVHCMVLRANARQLENAKSMQVELILPSADHADTEDGTNGNQPRPEWFLRPERYFRALSAVPDVKILVGHFPVSCKAVSALREKLYPGAKVVLVNHGVSWMAAEHLKCAEQASTVFSVGPKVFGHYASVYQNVKRKVKHQLFLPRPGEAFFKCKVDVGEPQLTKEQIQAVTGNAAPPGQYGEMITAAVAEALSRHAETGDTFPIWHVRNANPENYRDVKDALTRHQYVCSPYGCQEVGENLLQSFICIVPPDEPLGMQGLESIAVGLPVLIPKGSHLEAFFRKKFDEHVDYFLYDPANRDSLIQQLTKILKDPVVATARAKALKESYEKDMHITGTHVRINAEIEYKDLSRTVPIPRPPCKRAAAASRPSGSAGTGGGQNQDKALVNVKASGAALTDESDTSSYNLSTDSDDLVDSGAPSAKRLKQSTSSQTGDKTVKTQQGRQRPSGRSGQKPKSAKKAAVESSSSSAGAGRNHTPGKRRAAGPPKEFGSKLFKKGDRYPTVLGTVTLKYELKDCNNRTKRKRPKFATRRRVQKQIRELYEAIIRRFYKNKNPDVIQKLYTAFDNINTVMVPVRYRCKSKFEFHLSFRSDTAIDIFGFSHEAGRIDKFLTDILITPEMSALAATIGYTVGTKMSYCEQEYTAVQNIMREGNMPPGLPLRMWFKRNHYFGFDAYILKSMRETNHGRFVMQQARHDFVVSTVREEEFFFSSIQPYWYGHDYNMPETVTELTEYVMQRHIEAYCKEKEIAAENALQTAKDRLCDIGRHLYENLTEDTASRMDMSWLAKEAPDVDLHLFGLVKKSETGYSFLSRFLYMYAIGVYISRQIESSEDALLELKNKSSFEVCRHSMPHCFSYVCGLLGEKSGRFLELLTSVVATDKNPLMYEKYEILGYCLHETGVPKSFASSLENSLGCMNLDLYRAEHVPHLRLCSFITLVINTNLIKDVDYYSPEDKVHLSEELIAYLEENRYKPKSTESHQFKITDAREFAVVCRFLRFIPMTHYLRHEPRDFLRGYHTPSTKFLRIEASRHIRNVNPSDMEMFVRVLTYTPFLKTLTLSGVGPEFLRGLFLALLDKKNSANVLVRKLELPDNELTFQDVETLLRTLSILENVEDLDMSNNRLGNEGCGALLALKRCINVVYPNNGVGGIEEVLPFLNKDLEFPIKKVIPIANEEDFETVQFRLYYVTRLDMQDASDELCRKVCNIMPFFLKLEHLNFSNRKISRDLMLLVCDSITLNRYLEFLALNNCNFSADMLQHILKNVFSSLKHLSLQRNDVRGEIAESFKHLTNLVELDLSCTRLSDKDIATIAKFVNPGLTHLRLRDNEITTLVEDFKHLKQLILLDLSHNRFECELKELTANLPPTLTTLDFSHNAIESVAQVDRLVSDFQAVEMINLSHNKLGAVGVQNLWSGTVRTRVQSKIDVSHNLSGISHILPYVKDELPDSLDLTRDGLKLGDGDVQVLFRKVNSVTRLEIPPDTNLSSEEWRSACRDVGALKNLMVLTLDKCGLDREALKALADSFRRLKILRHVNCSSNNFGNRSVEILKAGISSLHDMTQLNLSHNSIGSAGVDCLLTGDAPSSGGLQPGIPPHCVNLTHLILSHNVVNDDGLEKVCELVRDSEYFAYLDLSHNLISEQGIRRLMDAVAYRIPQERIQSLVHVDLRQNLVKDEKLIWQIDQLVDYMVIR